jgi:hypothetical protein
MNIESLIDKIDLFDELVVKSGFKRDVAAWVTALGQAETQSNLITMREMAEGTLRVFDAINVAGLPSAISTLLPTQKTFSNLDTESELIELLDDPEIEPTAFYSRLQTILSTLSNQLNTDAKAVERARENLSIYVPVSTQIAKDEKAIISVIFKDSETITGLKRFSRSLHRWDQAMLMYHKLLKSESPEEIRLLEVQNGSIDVIINLDVDVTLNFLAALAVGYRAFNAYLKWKTDMQDIVQSYAGNKELLELNSRQESLLLDNIEKAIRSTVETQHKAAKKIDKNISKESPAVKIDRISALLAEHITKGNEVRLLSANLEETDDNSTEADDLVDQTRKASELRRQLSSNDMKLLQEKYTVRDEETETS